MLGVTGVGAGLLAALIARGATSWGTLAGFADSAGAIALPMPLTTISAMNPATPRLRQLARRHQSLTPSMPFRSVVVRAGPPPHAVAVDVVVVDRSVPGRVFSV